MFDGSGDRPDAPNVALVFTDGASNIEAQRTIPNAIDARERGNHIVVFGVKTSFALKAVHYVYSNIFSLHVLLFAILPEIFYSLKPFTTLLCSSTIFC